MALFDEASITGLPPTTGLDGTNAGLGLEQSRNVSKSTLRLRCRHAVCLHGVCTSGRNGAAPRGAGVSNAQAIGSAGLGSNNLVLPTLMKPVTGPGAILRIMLPAASERLLAKAFHELLCVPQGDVYALASSFDAYGMESIQNCFSRCKAHFCEHARPERWVDAA